jgi:glycosyltransferase involved in cell wall biosynthesis
MKVMFVSTRYHPYELGGAEATVRLLAEGLVRAGGRAVVVSLAPDGKSHERTINGVRVHYIPLFNVFFPHGSKPQPAWRKALWQLIDAWNPVMAYRVRRIADRETPDIVHLHNIQGFTCAIWPALAKRGLPMLQTLHDHYTACTNSVMYRAGANCARRCVRCRVACWPRMRLSSRVNGLTSVSERLWQRIGPARLFRDRCLTHVINNCNADPPAVTPYAGPQPDAPLRIGFIGRLEPIKGTHILLAAAQRIGAERVRVVVAGSGQSDYVRDLKASSAPPLTIFLGHTAPADFFRNIDVLVVPSLVEEASPRVVHEAFGFGVPVIGAAAGGIVELIREGSTGFLVPPGDINALEMLLHHLIENPPNWRALSSACLREAERFTFDRIFCAYRAAWRDVLQAYSSAAQGSAIQTGANAMALRTVGDARDIPP